jgi:TonB family protein
MILLPVAASILLAQSPVPPQAPQVPQAPPPLNCVLPSDPVIVALCAAEEALGQGERTDASGGGGGGERAAALTRAATAFRQAANLTHDPALKKRALEQLERLYDADHLDRPGELDPILRELMAVTGDLTPMFRLAKMQERQGLFDAAESTLLAARQQKPDDIAPYQELAQYFARRVAAMKAVEKEAQKPDPDTPGQDGVYALGGSIQAPEKISSESVALPVEVTAGGLTGSVTIMAVVDTLGRVTDAKILQSVRGLDDTALATVKQWRFAPATLNGQPVPVRMPFIVRFGGGAT